MRIDSVFEHDTTEWCIVQEAEVDRYISFGSVGIASYVPHIAFATGGNDVFTHLPIQYAGFIPYGRNLRNKFQRFGLAHVIRRIVA